MWNEEKEDCNGLQHKDILSRLEVKNTEKEKTWLDHEVMASASDKFHRTVEL